MRNLDFSSWSAMMTTLMGLVLVSVVAVGIRLVFMQTIQRRRERENRQINERLRTLIAAYKVLGGAFTGELAVDPTHRRDQRRTSLPVPEPLDAELLFSGVGELGRQRACRHGCPGAAWMTRLPNRSPSGAAAFATR